MAKQIEGVYEKVLECAKTEFLEKGFQEASLRTIAQNAGTSTGSIYTRFSDKAGLFDALVAEPANSLRERFIGVQEEFAAMPATLQASDMYSFSSEALQAFFDFLYENFDAFKLVICCGTGTDYDDYLNSLVEIECSNTIRFIEAMRAANLPAPNMSENLMHILASAYFSAVFEVVIHDMPRAEADEYIAGLTKFFYAGWETILNP